MATKQSDFSKFLDLRPTSDNECNNVPQSGESSKDEVAENGNQINQITFTVKPEHQMLVKHELHKCSKKQPKLRSWISQIDVSSPLGRRIFPMMDSEEKSQLPRFDTHCRTDVKVRRFKKLKLKEKKSSIKRFVHKYCFTKSERDDKMRLFADHFMAVQNLKHLRVSIVKIDNCSISTFPITVGDQCVEDKECSETSDPPSNVDSSGDECLDLQPIVNTESPTSDLNQKFHKNKTARVNPDHLLAKNNLNDLKVLMVKITQCPLCNVTIIDGSHQCYEKKENDVPIFASLSTPFSSSKREKPRLARRGRRRRGDCSTRQKACDSVISVETPSLCYPSDVNESGTSDKKEASVQVPDDILEAFPVLEYDPQSSSEQEEAVIGSDESFFTTNVMNENDAAIQRNIIVLDEIFISSDYEKSDSF